MSSKLNFASIHEQVDNENVFDALNIVVDEMTIDLQPKHNLAIKVSNGSLITGKEQVAEHEASQLSKLVVINRYGKPDYFVSYIKGFDLESGVIASSISHDYHNVVLIGKSDDEIRQMISNIKQTQGGIYTLFNQQFNYCQLDIAGLMSNESINDTYISFKSLLKQVESVGIDEPFLAMSFLTLDVIPYLKITDRGLFDFERQALVK